MYKKHRRLIVVIFIVVSMIGYLCEINYDLIASEVITIVSIALAVYIASFSQLASSQLANQMKNTSDKKIPGKSQLGVIAQYLKAALVFGLSSIVISCVCLVDIIPTALIIADVISSIALGVLSVNFVFIWLLFEFMINRQLRE